MFSVLLRFTAPLQSWNAEQNPELLASSPVPTFSGIVGMVANAMGRYRSEPILDLAALGYAARVDRAGDLVTEFHTQQWMKMSYSDGTVFSDLSAPDRRAALVAEHATTQVKESVLLSDAAFTVALSTGDAELAESIAAAVDSPARPLYLGKTFFPIGSLLRTGEETFLPTVEVVGADGESALADGAGSAIHRTANPGEIPDYSVRDFPVSFTPGRRKYLSRDVVISYS